MLIFDIITIFPEFFTGPLDFGVLRRSRERGLVTVRVHDLRKFTHDRHQTVDDRPFGGGEGMVLKPEPLFEAVEAVGASVKKQRDTSKESVILMSAGGKLFHQRAAAELARMEHVVLLCGRYEGVDERVTEHLADAEMSVGDFVLSGGEIAAALIVDAVTRLLPGALGNAASQQQDSFALDRSTSASQPATLPNSTLSLGGILDYPHYTRPAEFRGWGIPEILSNGDHAKIREWRREQAIRKTLRNRPDLFDAVNLAPEDHELVERLRRELREQ